MQKDISQEPSRLSTDYECPIFVPRRLLRNGHAQTVLSHFLRRRSALPECERRRFRVAEDVQVLCLCNWQQHRQRALTLVIVHGLEGSAASQYMVGTANKAFAAGMNVVRMNVRTCGGSDELCPTLYHSGMSGDIGEVVRELVAEDGLERVAVAGFSMGGNQVLKLAGEWGRDHTTPPQVRAVATVSPSMDLAACAEAIHSRQNRVYEWRFLRDLGQRLRRKVKMYPDRYKVDRWRWDSIADFDDCITAPANGFRDSADYYYKASAARVMEHINVPTLVIHSADDPMVRITPETRAKVLANPHIRFVETEHGGHCGFMAAPDPSNGYDGRWAEKAIIDFVQRFA